MLLLLMLSAMADPIVPAKLDRSTPVDYEKDIRPILQAKCVTCHAGKITEGDYDIGTVAGLIKGGKRGPAIVPGKPDESRLFTFSAHRQKPIMPPKSEDNPLTPQELALFERWIKEGAKGTDPTTTVPAVALRTPAIKPVRAVALDPKGQFAYFARGNVIARAELPQGAVTKFLDGEIKPAASHASIIESMALSPDGKILATGSFREVTLWDTATGQVKHRIRGFVHQVVALAFRADGQQLAAGGGVPSESGEVKLIDPATGKVIRDLPAPHSDVVYGVAYQPNGSLLATASADKLAKLFDTADGKPKGQFEGHTQHLLDVVWLPDGKRFATGGADGLLKIWDVASGEKVRDVTGFGKQATRMTVRQTTAFVCTGDGNVKAVNLENGGIGQTINLGTDYLAAIAVQNERILIGHESGQTTLYDAKANKRIREWRD